MKKNKKNKKTTSLDVIKAMRRGNREAYNDILGPVWKESAMAPFITSHGVGITVDSLRELPEKLKGITPQEYALYKEAAMNMKKQLNDGHYFRQAFEQATQMLS